MSTAPIAQGPVDVNVRGWMPIATAPRDGTPILAWNDNYGQRETRMEQYGEGSPGFALWKRGDGPLNSGWRWSEPQNNWGGHWSPTHWMPLPESPNARNEGPALATVPLD